MMRKIIIMPVFILFISSPAFAERGVIKINVIPDPPKLVVADLIIDDQSGNSMIEPMEMVDLGVRIQNTGFGAARSVTVDVAVGKGVYLAGERITHFEVGNIEPGQFKDVKFMFYTSKNMKPGQEIPITMKIREARFRVIEKLDLAMNARFKRSRGMVAEIPGGPGAAARVSPSDVDTDVPRGKKAGGYDVAVIIGNRNYKNAGIGVPDVDYADRDARTMKEYLITTFGFMPENIIYVEDATYAKFNEIFGSERDYRGKLYNYVKRGVSNVFIYYVGHGAPDLKSNEAYFVPVDANPQYIATNGFRLQTFYANLSKIPARKVTIVIDACFSGNSEAGLLFKGISPAMVRVKKEYKGPANALLITSAAVDQVSSWYPEKGHSLFTYYFLKGLRGEADLNGDGKLLSGEMGEYLKENVSYMARRLTGVEQVPVVSGNRKAVLLTFTK